MQRILERTTYPHRTPVIPDLVRDPGVTVHKPQRRCLTTLGPGSLPVQGRREGGKRRGVHKSSAKLHTAISLPLMGRD